MLKLKIQLDMVKYLVNVYFPSRGI